MRGLKALEIKRRFYIKLIMYTLIIVYSSKQELVSYVKKSRANNPADTLGDLLDTFLLILFV